MPFLCGHSRSDCLSRFCLERLSSRWCLTCWRVLGAILAPTDAALGQAAASSPRVPQPIRRALNIESGLNDGIALPVVLLTFMIFGALMAPTAIMEQEVLYSLLSLTVPWL